MSEEALTVLVGVSLYSPLLPLSALIILGKSASNFVWKALFVFLSVFFVCDYTAKVLGLEGINNMPVYHIYNFLTGAIICYYYTHVLRFQKIKALIPWTFVLFMGVSIFEFDYLQGYLSINTVSQFVLCIISLFFAMLWFYQVFFSKEHLKLTNMPEFWVNVGFFFYFGCTMVLTLFGKLVLRDDSSDSFQVLWPIQLVTNIVFNLIILKAVWALKRA